MSDEVETVIPKGQNLIGYCCYCGVEFNERVLTNRWHKCDSCESIFQCKLKTDLDASIEE